MATLRGGIDRELLLALMTGKHSYAHAVKTCNPLTSRTGSNFTKPTAGAGSGIGSERRNAPISFNFARTP